MIKEHMINADKNVTAQLYDAEKEEWFEKVMTIKEFLDAYTDEGCPNEEIVDGVLKQTQSIDIDDYIPIEYIKDFCKDCADEGIGTVSTYMEDAGEAILKSWLAVKDTDCGKKYKR